jgi:hypothetical protein
VLKSRDFSHSEYSSTHLSKTNFKTPKSQKPIKIKGLIDACLHDRRSHVTEKRRVKWEILGYFVISRYACVA